MPLDIGRRTPRDVTPRRAALEQALQLGCLLAVLLGFWLLVGVKAVGVAEQERAQAGPNAPTVHR
jgi:hypothetical protein